MNFKNLIYGRKTDNRFYSTGMIPTKKMTPHVPVYISEIVEDIESEWELGITKVHLHARDPLTENPTYKKEIYAGIMIRDLPENSVWSLAGIGNQQLKMNSVAIEVGGGVRVGLEDSIWYDNSRTIPASNADLIKRIQVLAKANDREIMTSEEFRQKMKFEPGNCRYGRKFCKNVNQ